MIPPSFHALPSIFSNRELPSKQQLRLIQKYIHQGRMRPTSISGKILIGHLVGSTILPEDIKVAITNHHPLVKIFQAKFGISKTINAGILSGSFQQESQQALTNSLETALWDQQEAGSIYIPITVRWDNIYSNGEHPIVWIPKVAHIQGHLIFKLIILRYWLIHFIILHFFTCNSYFFKLSLIKYLSSWIYIQAISNRFSYIFILVITNHNMIYNFSFLRYYFLV